MNFRILGSGRAGLIYSESSRQVRVDGEVLADGGFDLYVKSIKYWETSGSKTLVTDQERDLIVANISSYFLKRNLTFFDS